VTALLYVALGWIAVAYLGEVRAALGATSLLLLGVGGLLYTGGAVIYALRRPDPFPRVFGYHEIFHALVIAASICHFVVIAAVVRA
jgi:hemolysin III